MVLADRQRARGTVRRGRPPGTSRRKLELIALRLFTEQGFDETPIEQIAAGAGVSRRTFFRYFSSKPGVLWGEFDAEVEAIRAALAAVPAEVPMMDAIRRAVVAANHYRAEDVPELRARMNLIISVAALQASAAVHYDAWERAISDFAATRIGQPADSLYPLAVGRATLAVCRAAYDRWCGRAPTSPSISTRPSPRLPPDSRRHLSAPRNKRWPNAPAQGERHGSITLT